MSQNTFSACCVVVVTRLDGSETHVYLDFDNCRKFTRVLRKHTRWLDRAVRSGRLAHYVVLADYQVSR